MRSWLKYLIFISLLIWVEGCKFDSDDESVLEDVRQMNIMPATQIYKDLDSKGIQRKVKQIDSVFTRLKKNSGFNGVVLYAEKGRLIYEKAFGFADPVKNREPLETDNRFELASVSKMFTATAIMMLKQDQLLDYDEDIRTYIPEWPYEGITVRHLLTHRSGIARYESLADEHWPDKRLPLTNDQMIQLFVQYKPNPYFKPDGGFHYCNTNYALLASIVERVSRMDFDVFMKNKIFIPANMENSFIYRMPSDSLIHGYITEGVPGYDSRGRRLVKVANDYLNGVMGDKIMFSTVGDLYNFEIALKNELLVTNEILAEAYKPGSPPHRRRPDNYGFGWRIRSESEFAVYHYGWWKGFRSFFIRDLAAQKTLIVLTNKAKGPGSEHFWDIINDERVKFPDASTNPRIELYRNN
jgi:CubicO group peptidase (beta-lactamase class C family)